jgi:Flp pilus assembly protein TadD
VTAVIITDKSGLVKALSGSRARRLTTWGRHQDAIRELQAALDAGYAVWPVYSNLAVAYGYLGQRSEAEAALVQARKLNPKLTIKWYRARVEEPEIIFQGLLRAGLPEQ